MPITTSKAVNNPNSNPNNREFGSCATDNHSDSMGRGKSIAAKRKQRKKQKKQKKEKPERPTQPATPCKTGTAWQYKTEDTTR